MEAVTDKPDRKGDTMEDLTQPMELNRDTRRVLRRMRKATTGPTVVYGLGQELVERALRKIVDPVLEASGLVSVRVDQYHWFVRELSRQFRTRVGNDLAFGVELVMKKWQGYGLEPNTMQLLLCMIDKELRILAGETLETPDGEPEKKSGKLRTEASAPGIEDSS
jgi:hypothetical protein